MRITSSLSTIILPLFIIFTIFFSVSPQLYGLWKTPANQVFAGVNRWSADYYIYVSFVETGRRGDLREYHLTTTKPQDPIWIHGVYTISGFIGSLFQVDATAIYHVDRVLFGALYVSVLYLLLRRFFKQTGWIFAGMLFIFFIPGFPKTLDVFGRWDWRYLYVVQEMNIVGRSTVPPHYLTGFIFFIFCVLLFFQQKISWWVRGVWLAILATFMTVANPANLLTLLGTSGIYSGVLGFYEILRNRKKHPFTLPYVRMFGSWLILALGTLPISAYYQAKLSIFPWGPRSNALKFYIPGPPIDKLELILALGPVVIFAGIGIAFFVVAMFKRLKRLQPLQDDYAKKTFCLGWLVVQFGLFTIGNSLGMDPLRFLQGLYYIPLTAFALWGLQDLYVQVMRIRVMRNISLYVFVSSIMILAFMITLPTLILSYREELYMNTNYIVFPTMVYPSIHQYNAYKWMEHNTPFGSGVLAFYEVTEVLPAYSGNATERDLQHGDKLPFFSNKLTKNEARDFLKRHYFHYVWDGYQARAAGFKAQEYPFLHKIFENPEVRIYKVLE